MNPLSLSDQFDLARRAAARQEALRRDKESVHAQRDRRNREELERADDFAGADLFVAIVLAEPAEIQEFTLELDRYDTATIEALMRNEEALAAAREELKIVLDRATSFPTVAACSRPRTEPASSTKTA